MIDIKTFLKGLLKKMIDEEASDLHLKVGNPPIFRIHGRLVRTNLDVLSPKDLKDIAAEIMTQQQQRIFIARKELDFAIGVPGLGRFRVNAYIQRGSISIVMRAIPTRIRDFKELNLPPILEELSLKPRGLILVTGTTGSGKSTTLAAMINHINKNIARNIITIEDPIEYLFKDEKSIISQREIGGDTASFSSALKHVLRQDPDVIMIGEIRDKATMDVALKAADTGHLVLSTLHTLNATETINRIISFYPPHQHEHVRVLLASTLIASISQRLIPTADGKGRVPAVEILINTARVKELILDAKRTMLIQQAMEEGYYEYGMQTFDQSVLKLYREGLITLEDALQNVSNPDEFLLRLKGIKTTSERWEEEDIVKKEKKKEEKFFGLDKEI
ncbi:MAG: PilT/PilU family type 4a pilus ATPase [candidate division WOR-3 bacterium]|uniref:PilT/PilU family type 4a pilus ATPase n=1 Tax=candidate division WOR-3 bacterium TaxID=2052148 RepID=A0A7V3ZSB4_UNCW3